MAEPLRQPDAPAREQDWSEPGSGPRTIEPATIRMDEPSASEERPSLHPTLGATTLPANLGPARIPSTLEERYRIESVLGQGGMGEVRLCIDRRIGREVALKVMRAGPGPSQERRTRFIREARIQGQLEHPAIVPVHDLVLDEEGDPYFTMKRVRGAALDQILDQVATGDPEARARHSTRKLLTAFSQVCLAIDFAHRRGVMHRDLKPSNLMLGDFGEVYVLDWGLAKPIAERDIPERRDSGPTLAVTDEPLGETASGAILGTLGYMAPEQLRHGVADPKTDVYALGCILFEILTLEPLHGRASDRAIMSSTLEGTSITDRLAACGRALPPELLHACARATHVDRSLRMRSARDLHDAIEAYLEGDRDLESRRRAAEGHVRQARAALEQGAAAAEAVQELGRALALDPNNRDAMATLVRLLGADPVIPGEVEHRLEASSNHTVRLVNRIGAWILLAWFPFLPLLLWMGLRRWSGIALGSVAIGLAAVFSWIVSRQRNPDVRLDLVVLVTGAIGCVTASLIVGPLFLIPGVAGVFASAFGFKKQWWWSVAGVATGCLMVLVPFALELAGVLPQSLAFDQGTIRILPNAADFPRVPTLTFLVLSSLCTILANGLLAGRMRAELGRAERRLQGQRWLLSQLVPEEARDALNAPRPKTARTTRP